jgi:LysW-gamma-L-lysine carboxypeptidase
MTESRSFDSIMILKELVSIPSESGKEKEAVEYLIETMKKLGLDVHKDETGNAVGTNKGSGPHVLLVGHIDTVPGFITVHESDNRLFGRGCVDAKGPLLAMVFAAANFVEREDLKVTVIGAVEEEDDSRGARGLKGQYDPDYIIIGEPSGWDSICIGYKGHLRAIYKYESPKKHGAHPEPNAIENAIAYYTEVKRIFDSHKKADDTPLFETLTCTLSDIIVKHDEFNTTAELILDFRIPPDFPMQDLEEKLKSAVGEGTLEIDHSDPPVLVGKNNRLVKSLLHAIRQNDGSPKFKKKTGTSDMNVLSQFWEVPIISYGPGDSRLDHTPDEHIDLDEFRRAIGVLSDALEALSE